MMILGLGRFNMHLATKVPNMLVMRSAYEQRRSFKDSLPFPSKQKFSGLTFEKLTN